MCRQKSAEQASAAGRQKPGRAHRPALDLNALHVVARVLAGPRVLKLDEGKAPRLLRVVVTGDVYVPDLAEPLSNLPQVVGPAPTRHCLSGAVRTGGKLFRGGA